VFCLLFFVLRSVSAIIDCSSNFFFIHPFQSFSIRLNNSQFSIYDHDHSECQSLLHYVTSHGLSIEDQVTFTKISLNNNDATWQSTQTSIFGQWCPGRFCSHLRPRCH
jgi:hypothetical protein